MQKDLIEEAAIAVERQLDIQEAVLTDPLTLKRLLARRVVREAIAVARPFIFEEAAKDCEATAQLLTVRDDHPDKRMRDFAAGALLAEADSIRSLSKDGEGLDDQQG